MTEERLRSARETAKRPVGGFLLDGFQGNPATLETRLHLLSSVTAELPEDKPRLVFRRMQAKPGGLQNVQYAVCSVQSLHGRVF